MAGAAISGLFAIFHDDKVHIFRIKNIPNTNEACHILNKIACIILFKVLRKNASNLGL
jgi:hypothetical protein